jgi:hypothetical protein
MDVALYTGNGSTQTISGLNFSPDLVWIKYRNSGTYGHLLFDQIRGATNWLSSNSTIAEITETNSLTTFNSSGFALGAASTVNENTGTYAAWTWDAGSSTVTNTEGSITSQVRANASAGFSVVTYTGNGNNATVGHGLGVLPGLIIIKGRNTTFDWRVWHPSFATGNDIQLNQTTSVGSAPTVFRAAPTSTVISIGTGSAVNGNTNTYVAYCFAPVAGYSAFGSYTGNGSATDGPFVYTGMRPRWVMVKVSSASGFDWLLFDSARDTYNATQLNLRPNLSTAESSQSANLIDFLSNGFKLRGDSTGSVNPNQTLIYAAFGEHPLQSSRAR